MVDALVGSPVGRLVIERLRGQALHVPAHFDAEVLSALGRLQRAGALTTRQVASRLTRLEAAPIKRHLLPSLVKGAWRRRHNLRLVDALYAQLAADLGDAPLITTDNGLALGARKGELIEPPPEPSATTRAPTRGKTHRPLDTDDPSDSDSTR
jgi:predicted nucleic acid-binding protein